MPLHSGTRVGVFEIIAPLGAGGMGEVYRATDTNLKRQVAIKVLPAAVAADSDRLARFKREAEVLASLNHSNIAQIHGLEWPEDREGTCAIVMELVEGPTLADRIAAAPLATNEALLIAKQVADALEAAHEQGIVHRDLKPANIKVRSDGTVKVLDFGLAKAMDVLAAGVGGRPDGLSMSPTLTSPAQMTGVGVILGTAAYMAPEQAKGRAVDKRADIWAFGVVLHEMLTGRRLFEADDVAETLAAVLTRDVTTLTLPESVPLRLRALLRDCLVREPKQRLRDIGDARIVLERIVSGAPDTEPIVSTSALPAVPGWRRALPWTVAAAALVIAGSVLWADWAASRAEKASDHPVVRLDVDLGDDVSLPAPTGAGSSIAISADGTRLAYVSGTPTRLFVRRLDQAKAVELAGTQGATQPTFSPDGQWVAFVSGVRVAKIAVDGGSVVPIGDFTGVRGLAWSEDGDILVSPQKLLRIPTAGGTPEIVGEPRSGELGLVTASELLTGGRVVLTAVDNPGTVDKTTVDVITPADHQRRTVVQGGASPRYVATGTGAGHLLYVNGSTLYAVAFDLKTLSTRGPARPIVDDVAHDSLVGTGQFSVSRTGTLVYRRAVGGAGSGLLTPQWLDTSGRRQAMGAKVGVYRDVTASPDGARIAMTLVDGDNQDVWVYDVQRDNMRRLTFGGAVYRAPQWSPDGRYIVFSSVGKGIDQVRADGGSQPQRLTISANIQYPTSFSPDGRWLAFDELARVRLAPIDVQDGWLKAGAPEAIVSSGRSQRSAAISPDGRWIAYESEESGASEVYVRPLSARASDAGGQWLVSNNGGSSPHWSRKNNELLYQVGDQIMAVRYTVNGETFVTEKPRVWAASLGGLGTVWDLMPDGTRLAVLAPAGGGLARRQEHVVVFVQNFFDELRRRVPLK